MDASIVTTIAEHRWIIYVLLMVACAIMFGAAGLRIKQWLSNFWKEHDDDR